MSHSLRDMTNNFQKLDKFEGIYFCRWQKKMHFMLTTLKVVYMFTQDVPAKGDDETAEQTRHRLKMENDNYICVGNILNGMTDALFDVYQNAYPPRSFGRCSKRNTCRRILQV